MNLTQIVERASDGTDIPVASCDVYTHIVGGVVQYEELTFNGKTYRKTYTWVGGSVTESKWVRQP